MPETMSCWEVTLVRVVTPKVLTPDTIKVPSTSKVALGFVEFIPTLPS